MAYIKVLAIVLCSCFIQDALSGQPPNPTPKKRQATETEAIPTEEQSWALAQPAGGNPRLPGAKPRLPGVNPKQTGVNPTLAGVSPKLAGVNPKLAGVNQKAPGVNQKAPGVNQKAPGVNQKVPGVNKQGKVVNPRRAQRAAILATRPRPEYTYLEQVQKMFWDMAEEINTDKENGNKIMRAVRNSMGAKTDPAYWNALQTALRWYGKPTSNAIKAETRLRMCNAITDALTRPDAPDQFLAMVSVVINSLEHVDAKPYVEALGKVHAAVDDGSVTEALNVARAEVDSAVLDPALITKLFNKMKYMMTMSNMLNVTDGVANGLNKIGSTLNKKKT